MFVYTSIHDFLSALIACLFTFCLWWLAGYLVERSFKKLANSNDTDALLLFLGSIARKGFFGLGLIFAIGKLGFDVNGIVAGLGLTGFALGFAFKDALSNLIAGIFLLFYRPFGIGDTIRLETPKSIHEGRVTTIDLRYTTLKSGERTILIPNSFLLTEPISISK